MKKVLNGIQSFHALGLKKQLIAVAICAGLGMSVNLAHAASPNVSPPSVKAGAPNVYVVKKGDTLWDISGKFLSKPWRWPEIWASNKHVKNPHWIYPGDKLLLCSLNGKPLIGKDEGDGCDGIIRRYSGNTSNLRPQVRIEALNNSVPVIPLAHIQQWLERTSVLPAEAIANTPYILGTADNRVLAGKGQSVYVRGQGLENGQRYGVFREGQPYIVLDPNGKKQNLGVELTQVASGVAITSENDITTVELTDSYNGEVRRGDRVMLEQDAMLPTLFYPTDANQVRDGGKVIRVMGSIGTAAKNGVVTVDRGTADGVEIGQVFSTYQEGETVRDPKTKEKVKLPGQYVGSVMIFKSFDRISYAYVLESELPIKVGSDIKPPRLDD